MLENEHEALGPGQTTTKLRKSKHTEQGGGIRDLSEKEKRDWEGNNLADSGAKGAVEWHEATSKECEDAAAESAWNSTVITSIGNFLGALPAARELYAEHVDDTPQEQAAGYDEEDPFGHQLAGMNDGPTACEEQGLFDRVPPTKAPERCNQPEGTHC